MIRYLLNMVMVLALAAPAAAQVAAAAPPSPTREYLPTVSVQDIARLDGHGKRVLRGLGLVVGLPGTGDSGADLAVARPLVDVYRQNGQAIGELRDLAKARSVALVWVDCEIPEHGARRDDAYDVSVSVIHSATSLNGGRLLPTSLLPPRRDDDRVFAVASGEVTLERDDVATSGRVIRGAVMTRDVLTPDIGAEFLLVVDPPLRAWTTTRQLANQINGLGGLLGAPLDPSAAAPAQLARALDESTIRVSVPEQERADPANFVAEVLSLKFSPTLLDLPAGVYVNMRTGSIVVTGDLQITTVAISHKDLVITTTIPPPIPSAADPLITQERWMAMGTAGRATDRARVEDLLQAFKALNIPLEDRVHILRELHRSGNLLGKLVIE